MVYFLWNPEVPLRVLDIICSLSKTQTTFIFPGLSRLGDYLGLIYPPWVELLAEQVSEGNLRLIKYNSNWDQFSKGNTSSYSIQLYVTCQAITAAPIYRTLYIATMSSFLKICASQENILMQTLSVFNSTHLSWSSFSNIELSFLILFFSFYWLPSLVGRWKSHLWPSDSSVPSGTVFIHPINELLEPNIFLICFKPHFTWILNHLQ